ncbi:hypothetical protein LA080_015323 [Diaporthe eres]|nr:hypothetical protein LA080_015323 [Diaporthe eres]
MDLAVAFCGATASDVVRRVEGSTRSDSLRGEDGGDGDDTTMETEGEREGHETQRAEGRRHQLPSVKTQASGPSARGSTREQITPSAPWAILDRGEGSKRDEPDHTPHQTSRGNKVGNAARRGTRESTCHFEAPAPRSHTLQLLKPASDIRLIPIALGGPSPDSPGPHSTINQLLAVASACCDKPGDSSNVCTTPTSLPPPCPTSSSSSSSTTPPPAAGAWLGSVTSAATTTAAPPPTAGLA